MAPDSLFAPVVSPAAAVGVSLSHFVALEQLSTLLLALFVFGKESLHLFHMCQIMEASNIMFFPPHLRPPST